MSEIVALRSAEWMYMLSGMVGPAGIALSALGPIAAVLNRDGDWFPSWRSKMRRADRLTV